MFSVYIQISLDILVNFLFSVYIVSHCFVYLKIRKIVVLYHTYALAPFGLLGLDKK